MTPAARRASAPSRSRLKATSNSHVASKTAKDRDTSSSESQIESVIFGNLILKAWYQSNYPEETVDHSIKQLLVCPFCFKYSVEAEHMIIHTASCIYAHGSPPGKLIYSKGPYSIYELDGADQKLYCQNLSLFGKLFLETKSVFYDVSIFLFYILVYTGASPEPDVPPSEKILIPTTQSESKTHKSRRTAVLKNGIGGDLLSKVDKTPRVVGFFSKEKISWDGNNLACILVFPPWQSMGFGQILMATSYELSKRDGKPGGPEKPLSDLGHRGYMAFWSSTIARFLLEQPDSTKITVQNISDHTFIVPVDVITALENMGIITKKNGEKFDQMHPQGGDPTAKDYVSTSPTLDITINKALISDWRERSQTRLESPLSSDGFLIGYTKRGVSYAIQARQRLVNRDSNV